MKTHLILITMYKRIAERLHLLTALACIVGSSMTANAQDVAPSGDGIGDENATYAAPADEDIAGSVVFVEPDSKPHRFFTFTFQNDVFLNRDFGYTNGIGLTFGKGPFLSFTGNVNPLVDRLSRNLYIRTMPNKVHGIANMFFQRMQTPEDLTISTAQLEDFPYVGLLALQTTLYAYDRNQSDQFSSYLGVVGPAALADESQTLVHKIVGAEEPQGWDTQIDNELVFKLEAVRVKKIYRSQYAENRGFDVLGIGHLGLGTISSEALVGLAVRWGSNLDFSHATFSLQPDRQVNSLTLSASNNFFTFIGVQGGYFANDIMIDGNTFRDSQSLPLRHGYNQVSAGVVFKYGKLSYVAQVTDANSRSTSTSERLQYGAFSITWNLK